MKTVRETITPEQAQKMLLRNTDNRPMSWRRVEKYARDMRAGAWAETHQGIAFYEDGVLADGQKRLQACVDAGVPFTTLVTYDLPRRSKVDGHWLRPGAAIDEGEPRGIANQLHLHHKVSNANFMAASVVKIAFFVMPSAPPPSAAVAWNICNYFRKYLDEHHKITFNDAKRLTVGYLAAPLALYSDYDYDGAIRFITQASTLESPEPAVSSFRNWFDERKNNAPKWMGRSTIAPAFAMRILARCLADFHSKEPTRRKRLLDSDTGRDWLLGLNNEKLAKKIKRWIEPIEMDDDEKE